MTLKEIQAMVNAMPKLSPETPKEKRKQLLNEAMAKFPKSAKKRIAIENATMASGPAYEINMNLAMDARLYSWNSDTVNAIKYVLKKEGKI